MAPTPKRESDKASPLEEEDDEEEGLSLNENKSASKKRKRVSAACAMLKEIPVVVAGNAGKDGKQSMLVQVESGEYEGDTGAIGRLNFKPSSPEGAFSLDLRGREHDAEIRPSRAFFVLSVGPEEAKIETLVSECIHLSNSRDALAAFGAGAVVRGDLDDSYRFYAGDVDVNAPASKKKSARPDEEEEDADDAVKNKKTTTTTKKKAAVAPEKRRKMKKNTVVDTSKRAKKPAKRKSAAPPPPHNKKQGAL